MPILKIGFGIEGVNYDAEVDNALAERHGRITVKEADGKSLLQACRGDKPRTPHMAESSGRALHARVPSS